MKNGFLRLGVMALAAFLPMAIFVPVAAGAKPVLVTAAPEAGAKVPRVSRIVLGFDAPLLPGSAGAEIVMTGMPGMATHAPMLIKAFTTSISDDGKTLTLALRKPLPAGSYTVRWRAIGADKTQAAGALDFMVE